MSRLGEYEYKGFGGCDCVCFLDIRDNVVIATELDENEGTSITNAAEKLATRVCQEFGIDPKELIWIEHYTHIGEPDTWDMVSFAVGRNGMLHSPKWRPMSETEKLLYITKGKA